MVIRPLLGRRATIVQLAVVTVAIEMILFGFINIYADFLTQSYKYFSRFFVLRMADFSLAGLPGIFWISIMSCAVFIVTFHLILTKTKFGIGLRATVENSSLAAVLGVNVDNTRAISWFLTGSTCGVVGCLLPLWLQVYPTMGVTLIISVMAGSILGGLSSIYGAMIGGFIIGLTEMLGTSFLMQIFGTWVSSYKLLIPLGVMVVILMKTPDGISGLMERYRARKSKHG
jgi:branched-chain amino acid transport system permease protein